MKGYEDKVVIFVFGSNLAGKHGAGAAAYARQHHGAIYGRGQGLQNRSYAIPTKDWDLKPLPLEEIESYVKSFVLFAKNCEQYRPDTIFRVTRIGCGLAALARGVKPEQADAEIAPMFKDAPMNCKLPRQWRPHLPERSEEGFVPVGYH